MRSLIVSFLLACVASVFAGSISHDPSAPTNSVPKPSIYVDGEVQKPGRYDWFSGMTVVDAINAAGGLSRSASHRILIVRADGSRIVFHMDSNPNDVKKAPALYAGDVVSVRRERPNKPLQATGAARSVLDGVGDSLLPGFVAASLPAPVPELWR